mmetsp:Transcript_6002/g.6895  ORF Transcript_6002/g.6895 Transcript_6002/m.6895 type:complete len:356 (-) Transcript_6002:201-1268(-)
MNNGEQTISMAVENIYTRAANSQRRPKGESASSKTRARKWTDSEDRVLLNLVQSQLNSSDKKRKVVVDYKTISQYIPGRTSKQCRERYENSLNPDMKRGEWEDEETELILDLMSDYGQNWSRIKEHINNRTYNGIKKKGRKLLGEILDRSCVTKTCKGKSGKDWDEDEELKLLDLHRQHRYKFTFIAHLMRSGRSVAELDRKLLEKCQCQSCTSRVSKMREFGGNFKTAWSKMKAAEVKSKLLKRNRLILERVSMNSQTKTFQKQKGSKQAEIAAPVDVPPAPMCTPMGTGTVKQESAYDLTIAECCLPTTIESKSEAASLERNSEFEEILSDCEILPIEEQIRAEEKNLMQYMY